MLKLSPGRSSQGNSKNNNMKNNNFSQLLDDTINFDDTNSKALNQTIGNSKISDNYFNKKNCNNPNQSFIDIDVSNMNSSSKESIKLSANKV